MLLDGFIVKSDSDGVSCASDGFWKGADADRDKFNLSLHMSTYIFKIEILKKKNKKKINGSYVVFSGQQQCRALGWGVSQPVWGTTCMVMGISGSVTTSFPTPVIHDSDVFFLPRFMLNPSNHFTPSLTSHLSIFHSFLLPPPYMIHGARWCSDSPALWCAPHPSPNPQFFMSHTQQKGCKAHRFHISQILCSQGEGPRLKRCTSAF